jgi:hypothetical protein
MVSVTVTVTLTVLAPVVVGLGGGVILAGYGL